MRVGLIDYGAGNVTSVRNAFEFIDAPPIMVRQSADFDQVTHLVLPGVGSFPQTMERLRALELDEVIRAAVLQDGKPLLGICVGMQVLADEGHEFQSCPGLGLIAGQVRRLDVGNTSDRLPHIGWNTVHVLQPSPLLRGLECPTFYFVHSFNFEVAESTDCVAACDYACGVTACVQRQHIFGVQFHPEKSQHDGLQLLRNFTAWEP
ncbi:MAG: imidazole glycerol phosphate synthase subunit HisH [Phycisphaerae bacterium]